LISAGGAALDPKAGTQRRLPQADQRRLADPAQRVAKADGGGGLALAGRGGADAGHEDQRAVRPPLLRGDEVEADFGLGAAIRFQGFRGNTGSGRNLGDRTQGDAVGDFDVAAHRGNPSLGMLGPPWPRTR
jgi:hypothetical protein